MAGKGRGHYIAAWRQFRGLSQEQLAEAVGVTHATISRIETGVIDLKECRLYAIAQALSVSPGALLSTEPGSTSPDDDQGTLALWERATPEQKKQIARIVRALLEDNTKD